MSAATWVPRHWNRGAFEADMPPAFPGGVGMPRTFNRGGLEADMPRAQGNTIEAVDSAIDVFAGCQNRAAAAAFLLANTWEERTKGAVLGLGVGLIAGAVAVVYFAKKSGAMK